MSLVITNCNVMKWVVLGYLLIKKKNVLRIEVFFECYSKSKETLEVHKKEVYIGEGREGSLKKIDQPYENISKTPDRCGRGLKIRF